MRARVLLLTGALLLAAAGPALADAPKQTAYWWQGQSGPAPAPVTVPAGGLYVASTAAGPTAQSAVRFALAPGTEARTLSLTVHQLRQVDALAIAAYPTTASWKAGDNQPWSSRPDHAATPAFPATLGLDGVTLSFDLSAAHLSGTVDLVLTAAPPTGAADSAVVSSATFDATFEAPTPSALSVTSPEAAIPAPTSPPVPAPPPQTVVRPAPQHLGALAPAVPVAPGAAPGLAAPTPVVDPAPTPVVTQLTTAARTASSGRSTVALSLLLALVTFYLGWRTRGALLASGPRTSIYELPPAARVPDV